MQPLAMMCPAARIVNQAQARVFLRKESQSAQQPMVPWSMAWWSHRGVRKIIRVQLQYKPASWSIWETLYDDICNISYAFDLYCVYFALWYNYAIYTLYIYMGHVYEFTPVVHTCRSTETNPKGHHQSGTCRSFRAETWAPWAVKMMEWCVGNWAWDISIV